MKSNKPPLFADYVRSLRVKQGLTLRGASTKIGISVYEVMKWENGTSFPSEDLTPKITEVYGVSFKEWLEILLLSKG